MMTVEKINELKAIEAQMKELKDKADAIKEEFKAEMGNDELREVGGFKVHYTIVITNRLDSKRMKDEAPELYKKWLKEDIQRRFSIT